MSIQLQNTLHMYFYILVYIIEDQGFKADISNVLKYCRGNLYSALINQSPLTGDKFT